MAARSQTLRAIEAALREPERRVFCVAQREDADEILPEGLYTIGTIATLGTVQRGPGGDARRARGRRARHRQPRDRRGRLPDRDGLAADRAAAARSEGLGVRRRCTARFASAPPSWRPERGLPDEAVDQMLAQITEPGRLADLVAGYLEVPAAERQALLETAGGRGSAPPRADPRAAPDRRAVGAGGHPVQGQGGARRAPARGLSARAAARDPEGARRRRRVRPTRRSQELKAKLDALPLPDEARKEVEREWSRLARAGRESMESQVIRTYLETIAELPWGTAHRRAARRRRRPRRSSTRTTTGSAT